MSPKRSKKDPELKMLALAIASDWDDRALKARDAERFLMKRTAETLRVAVERIRQLEASAMELVWLAECELQTLEDLEIRARVAASTLKRHQSIAVRALSAVREAKIDVPLSGYPRVIMALSTDIVTVEENEEPAIYLEGEP